jgi:hypothetical protein
MDGSRSTQIIEMNLSFPRHGIFRYPAFIDEVGQTIGIDRAKFHDYNNRQRKRRKTLLELIPIEVDGVTGEMVICYYLTTLKKLFKSVPYLAMEPIRAADIIINGKMLDVKTAGKESFKKHFFINEAAHIAKDKPIDFYVCVKILDNQMAEYWVIEYAAVNDWEIRMIHETSCYCIAIDSLRTHENSLDDTGNTVPPLRALKPAPGSTD